MHIATCERKFLFSVSYDWSIKFNVVQLHLALCMFNVCMVIPPIDRRVKTIIPPSVTCIGRCFGKGRFSLVEGELRHAWLSYIYMNACKHCKHQNKRSMQPSLFPTPLCYHAHSPTASYIHWMHCYLLYDTYIIMNMKGTMESNYCISNAIPWMHWPTEVYLLWFGS